MTDRRRVSDNGYMVLVVEDSPTQAAVLSQLLDERGYRVRTASNGKEALAAIEEAKPSIIVSDVNMPEMDGYELCRTVKSRPDLKDLPVVLLTAQAGPQAVLQGLECGADNFICKPYDRRYLCSRLSHILSNQELRQQNRMQMGLELELGGKRHFINAERQQILDLLISASEEAAQANHELKVREQELEALARDLERRVEERTASLRQEVAERQQAEESFRAVVEASPDALIGAASDGTIKIVNRQAEKLFGRSKQELLGQLVHCLVPERLQENHRKHWSACFADQPSGCFDSMMEFVGLDEKGNEFPVEAAFSRMITGKEVLVLKAVRDISERKKLERQLQVSQKMEAVGLLAGGIAHDFNNLLSVILGQCDLLLDSLDIEDKRFKRAEGIKQAGEKAATLTRQLLAFGRRQVSLPEVLNLNTVIGDMEKMLPRLVGENIEVNTALEPALGNVKADVSQMEQIILNLAVNARDAMPGGGRLILETANVELDEAYAQSHPGTQPGSYVMLAVTDTGEGMDQETQAHIFEPFFTTKEQGKGTGLGLATVYGIIKQGGGNIWVYSEPGQGTSFKVYLPRVQEAVRVAKKKTPGAAERGWETILLAEDAEPLRLLAREFLEQSGYTVLEAADGVEAIEVAAQHQGPIHLLLTDVVMPKMTGTELARRLAATRPEIKVLYMSGYTPEAITSNGVLRHEQAFIEKPFRKDVLAHRLRELLDEPAKRPAAPTPPAVAPAPSSPPPSDSEPLDLGALKTLVGGDPALERRFLRKFLETAPATIQEIHAGYSQRSASEIFMAAHKLKSSARSVGANALADLCQSLEKAGRANGWEEIDRLEPQLDGVMATLARHIEHLLSP